jgi:hypothetical protein
MYVHTWTRGERGGGGRMRGEKEGAYAYNRESQKKK